MVEYGRGGGGMCKLNVPIFDGICTFGDVKFEFKQTFLISSLGIVSYFQVIGRCQLGQYRKLFYADFLHFTKTKFPYNITYVMHTYIYP